MTNAQFTYPKDKLAKWLLKVTLFLSVFAFSGYGGNDQSRCQQAIQTELVSSNTHTPCKRTIPYKKAGGLIPCNDCFKGPYKNWTNALFNFNILTKVKLNNISRRFCFHKSVRCFLQPKTIPQNSDADIFEIL